MVDNYMIINGYKYMWDGKEYNDKNQANEIENNYKNENFETRIIEENGNYLIYTRRVVTEIVVEG